MCVQLCPIEQQKTPYWITAAAATQIWMDQGSNTPHDLNVGQKCQK